jgi:hypothetical protein
MKKKSLVIFPIVFLSLLLLLSVNTNAITLEPIEVDSCYNYYIVSDFEYNNSTIVLTSNITSNASGNCLYFNLYGNVGDVNLTIDFNDYTLETTNNYAYPIKIDINYTSGFSDTINVFIKDGSIIYNPFRSLYTSNVAIFINDNSPYDRNLNKLIIENMEVSLNNDTFNSYCFNTDYSVDFNSCPAIYGIDGYLRIKDTQLINNKIIYMGLGTADGHSYYGNLTLKNNYIYTYENIPIFFGFVLNGTNNTFDGYNYDINESDLFSKLFMGTTYILDYNYYYKYGPYCDDTNNNSICDEPYDFYSEISGWLTDLHPYTLNYGFMPEPPSNFTPPYYNETNGGNGNFGNVLVEYNKCPNPADTNYIFCENFNYENDIAEEGWDYNTNLTRIFPEWYVFNSWGSLRTNDTSILHRLEGIFNNLDYATSYGGIFRRTYNYNINKLRFSYKTKINQSNLITYLQSESNGWEDTWGIDLFNRYGMFYQTNTSNKFYIYNYSRNDFDEFISLTGENAKVDVILYKARTFLDVSYCDFFVSITDALGEHNSSIYRAGYQPKSAIPDGLLEPAIYTYCNYVGAVGFEGEYEDAGALVDDVNVYVLERNSELKIHLKDRCDEELSLEFPESPLPMSNQILNISGTNYTTDTQGYLTVNGLGTGYYNIYITAFNVTNKFVLLSNTSQDFQEICFDRVLDYNAVSKDLGTRLNNLFSYFGILSTASKMLVAVIIIIIIIIGVATSIPMVSPLMYIILTILLVALFSIIGFIPLWVDILIIIASIASIFLFGIKRGD